MVDAMISRARLRDLARLGRSRLAKAGGAGLRKASIADDPSAHPRAASSRPEAGDLVASTI
jgi:hypothetical protein